MRACITLAIETGMRAGELLSLQWSRVDFSQSVVRLDKTKNGTARSVPLSEKAQACLQQLPRSIGGRVIPNFHDTSGLGRAFRLLCSAANVEGLHFHDLRHEAASRLAPHMPVQTLAKIMGWRTLQMAMRYYNPSERNWSRPCGGLLQPKPLHRPTAIGHCLDEGADTRYLGTAGSGNVRHTSGAHPSSRTRPDRRIWTASSGDEVSVVVVREMYADRRPTLFFSGPLPRGEAGAVPGPIVQPCSRVP